MRLKTMLLIACSAPALCIAGGTLGTNELEPLMAQKPAVRGFLRSNFQLSEGAYATVRFGPQFPHLSGGTMGPYVIAATSTKDGTQLNVVLCTSVKFLDSKGRKMPDARITQAVSIKEKLTRVLLLQEDDDTMAPPC